MPLPSTSNQPVREHSAQPFWRHTMQLTSTSALGVVNGKSLGAGKAIVPDGKHQYFYLERVDEWPAEFVEAA